MINIKFQIGKSDYKLWNDGSGNYCFGKFTGIEEKTKLEKYKPEGYWMCLEGVLTAILEHKMNATQCNTFEKLMSVQRASLRWLKKTFGQFDISVKVKDKKPSRSANTKEKK